MRDWDMQITAASALSSALLNTTSGQVRNSEMMTSRHFYLVYTQCGLHQSMPWAPGSTAGLQVSCSFLACDPPWLPPQLPSRRVPVLAEVMPPECSSRHGDTLLSIAFFPWVLLSQCRSFFAVNCSETNGSKGLCEAG